MTYIEMAEAMTRLKPLPVDLKYRLDRVNTLVQMTTGDGGKYGSELRSSQVVASIVETWERDRS